MRKSCTLFLLLMLLIPCSLQAALFVFVDEQGVRHFTNVPDDPRYKPVPGLRTRRQRAATYKYDALIRKASRNFKVDPHLIKAVIKAESDFDRYAVSRKGARGLMQLMPDTAQEMNVDDPFDPKENILGGTRYLSKLLDMFNGDIKLALAAYNSGPERVKQLGRIPRIPETLRYVKKVLKYYDKNRNSFAQVNRGITIAYD